MAFEKGHKDLRKDTTNYQWHMDLLEDETVRRWVENLARRSDLTAGVYRRGLGYYCSKMNTTPARVLEDAKEIMPLQSQFQDFISIMEKEGKKGAYLARYKKVLHSWTKFNNITNFRLNVNIANENINERSLAEAVPTKEELAKVLRKASLRERVSISLMAFSGLRPQVLGNSGGTDCLRIRDIPDLKINNGTVEFDHVPAQISVRFNLSKTKIAWITFLADEGCTYLKEYLEDRISGGEQLTEDSPVIYYERNVKKSHECMPTFYVTRDIREVIRVAGFDWRPYIFKAYFASALDSAQSKGIITGEWRAKFMGHKGNIESVYSVNKKLSQDKIDAMRATYQRCQKYIGTAAAEVSDENMKHFVWNQFLIMAGYDQKEIEEMNFSNMTEQDVQKKVQERMGPQNGSRAENGSGQISIPVDSVDDYLSKNYLFVASLGNGKVIMKAP